MYVAAGDTRVLLDCGLSAKQAAIRLIEIGVDPDSIDAIVLTHEHEDHSSGARVFSSRHQTPVYANHATFGVCRHLHQIPSDKTEVFNSGCSFRIGELLFEPFSLVHDASDPVGFRVSAGGKTLAVTTDLGQVTTLVRERLRGIDALVLEANHDPVLLQDAPYPWSLKQRISSRQGHLSNETAGELLGEVSRLNGARLQVVVAAHISEKSNTPELAVEVFRRACQSTAQLHQPEIVAAGPARSTTKYRL
jgi:phosphoribosyl 1,2-cyclic phosphodiesterase